MTRFDEPYKTACFGGVKATSNEGKECEQGMCKSVEYFHVYPTSYLRRRKGPAVPTETCKRWSGRKSLGDTFFQTHDDARDQLVRTFPSGKTEGNTGFIGFPHLFTGSPHGHNCELLNSMMFQICTRSRNRPSGRMSLNEINSPNKSV